MKKIKNIMILFSAIAVICIVSCKSNNTQLSPEQQKVSVQRDTLIKNAIQRKAAYVQELEKMDVEQLAQQAKKESNRGLEPFNSLAFAEAVKRGDVFAKDIVPLIKDSTKASLLNLLALDKISIEYYDKVDPVIRTSILLDALKNSELYNAFGMPHTSWELAGKVIIQEGKNIKKGLIDLLKDQKPAPVWGSEDYVEYSRYQYRVCDYALAFLLEIDGKQMPLPVSVEERDVLIKEYR